MRNPIAVLMFSLDHKIKFLSKVYAKLRIYELIYPYPFEHYCVFCAKYVSDDWWKTKPYYANDLSWMSR